MVNTVKKLKYAVNSCMKVHLVIQRLRKIHHKIQFNNLLQCGVNKVAGELLCQYYFTKFGVDTRSVRFPGLISHVKEPGGGTTDYAVEIYFEAVRKGRYTSYIAKDTYMDMMYMDDAIDAIIKLMEAR